MIAPWSALCTESTRRRQRQGSLGSPQPPTAESWKTLPRTYMSIEFQHCQRQNEMESTHFDPMLEELTFPLEDNGAAQVQIMATTPQGIDLVTHHVAK